MLFRSDAVHVCFDFRSNENISLFGTDGGYVDPDWSSIKFPKEIRNFIVHDSKAVRCYTRDRIALEWCYACVAVCPAGISCRLEVAYAAGMNKQTVIYLGDGVDRGELMWRLADDIVTPRSQSCWSY